MKAKRRPFLKVYAWAADKLGGMCNTKTAVFCLIYSFYESGRECYLSYKGIADTLGISRRAAIKAVNELEKIGAITRYGSNNHNIDSKTNVFEAASITVSQWRKEWNANNKEADD